MRRGFYNGQASWWPSLCVNDRLHSEVSSYSNAGAQQGLEDIGQLRWRCATVLANLGCYISELRGVDAAAKSAHAICVAQGTKR